MAVQIGDVLHVLAHELRTPVGIAHGYVRLLLEDRLPDASERRRALEQLQKALGRLSDLSHESSALANWLDRHDAAPIRVGAGTLIERATAKVAELPLALEIAPFPEGAVVMSADPEQLERALAVLIRATARELRGRPCALRVRAHDGMLQLLLGEPAEFDLLEAGPETADASPLEIDRGGLGLALVHASFVLAASSGICWSSRGSRQAAAIRLPFSQE
jgi:hypothetical protein